MSEKFVIRHANVAIFKISCAESEKSLNFYYKYNPFFEQAESFESLKTFFIGRTGIGKTAIIENLQKKVQNNKINAKTIKITPEDFVFDVAERSELIKELTNQNINLGLLYKTLWKSIILTEILKEVFGNKKKGVLEKLTTFGISGRAYKFLEKNQEIDGERSMSERVQGLIERMEHDVSAEFKISEVGVKYSGKLPADIKDKVNKKIQKFEISDLKYFISKLDAEILNHTKVYIFIDDLDKNWIPNEISKKLIGALFESITDFANLEKVKIIVSLRTNLFQQIELHQPEKYNQFIENIYWNEDDIHKICHLRINKIFQLDFGSSVYRKIFPDKIHTDNNKVFSFEEYLVSRTNLRPRDAIHFLSFVFEEALNKSRITQGDIFKGELKYSNDRLNALFNEWDNPFKGISFLKDFFSYTPHKLSKNDMIQILDNIFVYIEEKKNKKDFIEDWIIKYKFIDLLLVDSSNIIHLLYDIGLIGIKRSSGDKTHFSFQKGFENLPFSFKNDDLRFYINPCYYKALNTTFYGN